MYDGHAHMMYSHRTRTSFRRISFRFDTQQDFKKLARIRVKILNWVFEDTVNENKIMHRFDYR